MTASRQGFIAFDGSQTSEIASKYEPDLVCVGGEALFDGSADNGFSVVQVRFVDK